MRPSSLTRLLSFVSRLFADRRHRRGVALPPLLPSSSSAPRAVAIGVVTVAVHSGTHKLSRLRRRQRGGEAAAAVDAQAVKAT